jgi:hypothetical protein
MKVTRIERRVQEEAAVRIFLWVGLLTTMACASLAALSVTRIVAF